MSAILLNPPGSEPLSVADAKSYLRWNMMTMTPSSPR